MAADRHVQIGHDAQGNVIVTGDNGRVYVFPGITALSPELLAQLNNGALTLQEEPTAVPLPSLVLRIDYGDEQRTTWTIARCIPMPRGHHTPCLLPGTRTAVLPPPWQAFGISAAVPLRMQMNCAPSTT